MALLTEDEIRARQDELARRFERMAEPPDSERSGRAGAVLARLAQAHRALAHDTEQAIAEARRAGWTWPQIGSPLGVTGEAVRKRYAPIVAELVDQDDPEVAAHLAAHPEVMEAIERSRRDEGTSTTRRPQMRRPRPV